MTFFKQFSVSLMALATATAASAANLPISYTGAEIDIDASAIASAMEGYSIGAIGGANYNSATGLFRADGVTASLTVTPGPIKFELPDAAGLKLSKTIFSPAVILSNLSFDSATNELSGNLQVSDRWFNIFNMVDQSLLVARDVSTRYGAGITNNPEVSPGSTPGDLSLRASGFELSDSFMSYMQTEHGLSSGDAGAMFGFLTGMIQEVRVKPVPEPSSYALMGIGLLGIGVIAYRRRSA